MISIDIDINNSLVACQCNKERTNVLSAVNWNLNQLWGAIHDEKSLRFEQNGKDESCCGEHAVPEVRAKLS